MRFSYTFTVLRYVHDVVAGEFANVGVALYAPQARFLECRCSTTYGRLSKFFGEVEGDQVKDLMRRIQARINDLGRELVDRLPLQEIPADAASCVAQVLPRDDSALQFAPMGAGTCEEPAATLHQLYQRYVERYPESRTAESRTDEEIWPVFRTQLAERGLLPRLHPKRIVSRDYEHEFPHAWKNGLWNACEAVSFDLLEYDSIIEKANRWLGREVNLRESSEQFRLHLLLGKPSSMKLLDAFDRAQRILRKMTVPLELFTEEQAADFADRVRADLEIEET